MRDEQTIAAMRAAVDELYPPIDGPGWQREGERICIRTFLNRFEAYVAENSEHGETGVDTPGCGG